MNPSTNLKIAVFSLTTFLLSCKPTQQVSQHQLQLVANHITVQDKASTGGVSWIDYDQDGDQDLFITNGYDVSSKDAKGQGNKFYQNQGNGQFIDLNTNVLAGGAYFSSGSTWADFDNDGDLDVFVSNQRNQQNLLYEQTSNGEFNQISPGPIAEDGGGSYSCSWVDINQDGYVDLYVGNGGLSAKQPDFIYQNNQNGTFTKLTEGAIVSDSTGTTGGIWSDFDNDGDPDLFIPNRTGADLIYRNEGNWKFSKVEVRPKLSDLDLFPTQGACVGDFDNDGDIDLYVTKALGSANILYLNDGQGQFTNQESDLMANVGGHSYGANCADFDNDGDLDIVINNWGAASFYLENQGKAIFKAKQLGDLGQYNNFAGAIASSDYDNDGDLDLYIGHWPNKPGKFETNHLYRNDNATGNWLKIRLEGTQSNRSAIGAKIYLTATINGKETTQLREVSTHHNWRSQSGLVQHFGLGDAKRIEKIRILWPSKKEQISENLAINTVHHIKEE